jgi:hypothetical protein
MIDFMELPEEYLQEIGRVIVKWNFLEQTVNMFIVHLLGRDSIELRSHMVFAHMSFPQRLDLLGALVEMEEKTSKIPDLKKKKVEAVGLLRQAQTGRNSIIHSAWNTKDGKVMKASLSARGSVKFSWEETTVEDIKRVQTCIEKAFKSLGKLPYPPKRPPQSGQ